MGKEVRISFDIFGNSKVDALGFVGSSCEAATKQYLQVLASSEKKDTKKPEYSQPSPVGQRATQAW